MNKYTRVNWLNENDDGTIPEGAPAISAGNLNNIENGIEQALNGMVDLEINLKKYSDNNIMYFSGTGNLTRGKWTDVFKLPNEIDYSKYIALVWHSNHPDITATKFIPFGEEITFVSDIGHTTKIKISHIDNDSNKDMVISYYGQDSNTVDIIVVLLPVNKAEMITLT